MRGSFSVNTITFIQNRRAISLDFELKSRIEAGRSNRAQKIAFLEGRREKKLPHDRRVGH
jgi:hypothetical protein